ncbi:MAG: flagellar motor switch protein FliN [Candidatus Margulisbacteria bacterium]|nr:flagellar motor switch protein FliN [Candidatus Margulisiibacteriota bacterium]
MVKKSESSGSKSNKKKETAKPKRKYTKKSFKDPLKDIDPVMEKAFSVKDEEAPTPGLFEDEPKETSETSHIESVPEVSQVEFPELPEQIAGKKFDSTVFNNLPVQLSVELGRTKMSLNDIYELTEGAIIELERLVGEPLDLVINDTIIAQGSVVAVDNHYGLRITKILSTSK